MRENNLRKKQTETGRRKEKERQSDTIGKEQDV